MSKYIGDFAEDATLRCKFNTSGTFTGSPAVSVYKSNSTIEITAGILLTVDFDGLADLHHITIDLSADAAYEAGEDYQIVVTAGTVGGVSAIGEIVREFSIQNRYMRGTNSANTTAPATPTNVSDAQTAILAKLPESGRAASQADVANAFTVVPLTGVVENRVDGTTIKGFVGETSTVAIVCVDAQGESVSLAGKTLQVVIERKNRTDKSVIDDEDIGVSGSTFSFALPSTVTASEATFKWSLRQASDDGVLMHGLLLVEYQPTADS